MREIEVKVEVAPDVLLSRIEAAGAQAAGQRIEVDTYFQHPGRDFRRTDEALRLREADGTVLTYKGPRAGGAVKDRVEIEASLTGDGAALLEALGFLPSARITKHRRSWRLEDTIVTLDTLEGLGSFAEIEAVEGGAASVESALAKLSLSDAQRIEASYLELALAADAACVQRL